MCFWLRLRNGGKTHLLYKSCRTESWIYGLYNELLNELTAEQTFNTAEQHVEPGLCGLFVCMPCVVHHLFTSSFE